MMQEGVAAALAGLLLQYPAGVVIAEGAVSCG